MTSGTLSSPESDIDNARWFAVDLHVPRREFGFLQLSESVLEQSPFLDTRIDAPWQHARFLSAARLPATKPADATLGFLFHTSFCCSTLLANVLHLPPHTVALREPLVLRRLADARWQRYPADGLLPQALALLARPWHGDGKVLVKPTHAALSLACEMADAMPAARGIVLTSGLEDFLLSNIKKSPETQAKVPELVERAMAASSFATRLPAEAYTPPDFLSGVALQWAVQQELLGDLLAGSRGRRFRVLFDHQLLADVALAASACLDWLGWPVPEAALRERAAVVCGRHAKLPGREFSAEARTRETRLLRDQFAEPVREAMQWAERLLLPVMQSERDIKRAQLL